MGWKSTITITESEARLAIAKARAYHEQKELTAENLERELFALDVGDNPDLPYYGHNFEIVKDEEKSDST